MMFQILLIAALAGVGLCGHGIDGEVGPAIEHVDWEYSDKLCLDLLMVDCSKHVTQNDEQICGTNGITYDNHCKYSHAYCEFSYSDERLHVASHGPCPVTTAAPATTASVMGTSPDTSGQTGATNPPSGATMTSQGSTGTTKSNSNIIQDVFCMNADAISCQTSGVDVICATNGVLYPNQCEFAKAHCKIPTLAHDDPANCASIGK